MKTLLTALGIACLSYLVYAEEDNDKALLHNGGFETLRDGGETAENWSISRSAYEKDVALTGTVTFDEKEKHSGNISARITNTKTTDITLVRYLPKGLCPIKPNTRYKITWWVKGEDVTLNPNDGAGPMLMLFHSLQTEGVNPWQDGTYRMNAHEKTGTLPKGTFGWQKREFDFVTGPHSNVLVFTLQLRRAKGTVWYDDVTLTEEDSVVKLEEF